ncbi:MULTISPECIES: hypothetical protein [Hungatella]|uniref:hypothetical protein n=1 Tax=Hungatella TaxID=1649459 RepID=UPI002586BEEA|nr:hypothetical protein [Hungatella sp.]
MKKIKIAIVIVLWWMRERGAQEWEMRSSQFQSCTESASSFADKSLELTEVNKV